MDNITLTVVLKNRIRVLMAENGFKSIQALAAETGISPGTLYGLDNGTHTNLSLENVCKLLWVFNCSFEELFQFEVESNEPLGSDALSDEALAALRETEAETKEFMTSKPRIKERRNTDKALKKHVA